MAHLKVKDGELAEVGRIQPLLHSLYARCEPLILKVFDRLIKIGFLTEGRGKPILKAMARLLSFLPTAEVVTLERAEDFIDAISVLENSEIAVGPCVCQKALGRRNGTFIKDIVVLYGAEAYKRARSEYSDLSPEEAKRLLRELHQEGLIPAFYACMRSKGWVFVICNCEREICLPFRAHQAAGGVLSPGPDIVTLDRERCAGCGICVERCHFGANRLVNGFSEVDLARCYGCGLCVSTCTGEARRMTKREDYSNRYYPIELVSKASAH
jgi:NAD-dependent dihydropyrimidine dehydrogenase PreA subunit